MRLFGVIWFFGIIFLIAACSSSPIATGAQAERNMSRVGDIEVGMTSQQVFNVLGRPDKTEMKIADHEEYVVWYYLSKGTDFFQTRMTMNNYMPFVFKDHVLQGFGMRYYKYVFNIRRMRDRYESEERQKYTDDRDEWPSNEHKILSPNEVQEPKAEEIDPIEKQPIQENEKKSKTEKMEKSSECEEEDENPWWE